MKYNRRVISNHDNKSNKLEVAPELMSADTGSERPGIEGRQEKRPLSVR